MTPNDKLIFIHIPKTGGTTVVDILQKQIYFEKFVRLNPTRDTHPKDFLSAAPKYLENVINSTGDLKVIGGHLPFGATPSFQNPNSYFTVLRDPVERVISEYYYMKQLGYFHQQDIQKQGMSLMDYLHHPNTRYLNNLQTRLISGVGYEEGEEVNINMLKKAIANIKSFAAIGITERMPETLALFHSCLSWSSIPHYSYQNVNNQRPAAEKIDIDSLKAIRKRERHDIVLYNEARSLFQQQIDKHNQAVNKTLKEIKSPRPIGQLSLKIYSKLRRALKKADELTSLTR